MRVNSFAKFNALSTFSRLIPKMAPRTRKKEHVNSKPSEKDSAEKSRGKKRKVDEEVENTDKGKKGKTAAEPTVKTPDDKFTHWLIKSEPETRIEKGVDMRFSFEDLKQEENSTACWDGVRNYQARNFMRMMKVIINSSHYCFIIQISEAAISIYEVF